MLSQGLAFLAIQQGYANDYSALFAAMTITMVPTLVVYVIFQRRLESGLTRGAHKGLIHTFNALAYVRYNLRARR